MKHTDPSTPVPARAGRAARRRVVEGGASAACLLLGACAWTGSGPGCRPLWEAVALPEGLEEASGVAMSAEHGGVFWSHGDGGDPSLFAVDSAGVLLARVRLETDELVDWEDVALAACGQGDCLYVADVGDNLERRDLIRVLRVREPDPRGDATVPAEVFRMRLPEGARDIEAIFVLPGERLHLVSKGVNHPVSIYRYPGALRTDSVARLEETQRLSDGPRALPRQVTGAGASRDGGRVAIRTYEALILYRVEGDSLAPLEEGTVNLRTLAESQGEGVAVGDDGRIALTSEAGPAGRRGSLAVLRCRW
jgi:hypothetical protein